jgi:TolA-binding protein
LFSIIVQALQARISCGTAFATNLSGDCSMCQQKKRNNGKRLFKLAHVRLFTCVLPVLICTLCPSYASASPQNVLYRILVKQHPAYTRLTFRLERDTDYSLAERSGNSLKITFPLTSSLQSSKLRTYSDSHIERISFVKRNGNAIVIIAMKSDGSGYRVISPVRGNLVAVDIGPYVKSDWREPVDPGRAKIWSGTEKLIREFESPLRPDVPFIPTDGKMLRKLVTESDVKRFLRGEAAVYKEKPAEAEEIFRSFLQKATPVRAIASFRLGEALYMAQKYTAALAAFREGERLNPEYMAQNPSAIFYYADCLVRGGNFEEGRKLLLRLIIGLAWTEHGPSMLVRLGDIYARAGYENQAVSIYRNVVSNFRGTRAFQNASMRLNDRDYFRVNSVTCRALINKYRKINAAGSDVVLQDESLFKASLLEALFGPSREAVSAISEYEKRFPSGAFISVAKAIREDLLPELYHDLERSGDCRGLTEMVEKNRNYLSRCLSEENFLHDLSRCYAEKGMIREELKLFMDLVGTEWATASAPFLYSRIFNDALILNEDALAEGAGREFVEKFPRHPLVWVILGRLGEICYRKGNMRDAGSYLSRLLEKGSRVEQPESFYYLGKARERLRDPAGAEKAMALFQDELQKKGLQSPFQPDSFLVRASSRLAGGDRKGAMAMYQAGYSAAQGELRDACLFKMGDLYRRQGDNDSAKNMWKKIVREGTDPLWKKMATRELSEIEWQEKWKSK